MELREELKYTKEHEWIAIDDDLATLGITDYAQDSMGDVVYVELPEVGTIVEMGEALGNIESVKAVSEIFCPFHGEVVEINKDLEDDPSLVNSSPYDKGWMIKLRLDTGDLDAAELMSMEEYAAMTKG